MERLPPFNLRGCPATLTLLLHYFTRQVILRIAISTTFVCAIRGSTAGEIFIHINLSDWWYSPQPAVGPNFGRLKVHSSCRRGSLRRVTIQL
ncbi:MAG: hypothetical protein ACTS44_01155, partial [Candidatus Hodgkinia cicadicola]